MQLNLTRMTLKILLNILQTNFHLVLLVKMAFKNKMYNKIKLETQDQRVLQSTQGQLLSDNYQCSLHCGWMSYELLLYVQIRVCFFPLYFPKLKLYNVLKLHSFCSVLKSFFAFNILALNCIALTVCSLNKQCCASSQCPHCKLKISTAQICI